MRHQMKPFPPDLVRVGLGPWTPALQHRRTVNTCKCARCVARRRDIRVRESIQIDPWFRSRRNPNGRAEIATFRLARTTWARDLFDDMAALGSPRRITPGS